MNSKETQLQQGITQLRTRLLVMGAAVGIAVEEACSALVTGNTGRAVAVVDGDVSINEMENEIDEMALSLLVRNQPVAHDLRLVVGSLRLVIDLERIGDEAAGIAEKAILLQESFPEPILSTIVNLMETAKDTYQKALASFRLEDEDSALAIIENADECAQKEVMALQRLMDHMYLASDTSPGVRSLTGMHGILISRSLSRICRRSSNIAEHVYFIARGVNIKHCPLPSGAM